MKSNPTIIVPADQTVFDEYIVCMFDGEKRKMMHRHVMAKYGMTWDEYKAYCNLPHDYPAVAAKFEREKTVYAGFIGAGETLRSVSVSDFLAGKAEKIAASQGMTLGEFIDELLTEAILEVEHPDLKE